jgi:hypothetical protein
MMSVVMEFLQFLEISSIQIKIPNSIDPLFDFVARIIQQAVGQIKE